MFVHNKRSITPTFLDCDGIHLTAVTKFKLLGFIIDQKLEISNVKGQLSNFKRLTLKEIEQLSKIDDNFCFTDDNTLIANVKSIYFFFS